MHVLILPSWYPARPGDVAGVFFRDQAQALAAEGIRVGVIAPRLQSLRHSLAALKFPRRSSSVQQDGSVATLRGVQPSWLPRVPYGGYWLWLGLAEQLLQQYMRLYGKPDVVHAHVAYPAGAVAARWQVLHSIPFALTEHSTGYARGQYRGWQLSYAARAAKAANSRIAVSPSLAAELMATLHVDGWINVPNVVAERFQRYETALSKPEQVPFRFLNVALMTEKKGQRDLIAAFARAFDQQDNVELVIGGDGPLRSELQKLAESLGLQKRLHFLGAVSPDAMPPLMADADAFVLSSHFETFGVVAAEALTVGTPVVATRCGGPEHIVGAQDGELVSRGNVSELAAAMQRMYKREQLFDRQQIRERALARFAPSAVAHRLIGLYSELLA